ncbi:GNAT family N-acetyltransferase [Exiguobacterium sp. MER 193]|uniref:GNAT family N-acetyltransferase n=1 Tax=Exiguobacterium sp. MER 193 TaxID=2939564 RepID=UPI00203AAE00|nr:GNAT family N-acetyltransferase [Exiguobacterium sp. MER 193]MCM3281871.1 GNAT family N-acetyltransferase [Exiguobacterium sp. MER 193]
MNATIHLLTNRLDPNFLNTFERFQETHRIYAVDSSGELYQKDEHYIDEWDDAKKQQVIEILNYYIDRGGVVVAIQNGETLLDFAGLNGQPLGTDGQYLNLGFIHVSRPCRGQGIGKRLFERVCQAAVERGAKKLYIGANPAVDTYHDYGHEFLPPLTSYVPPNATISTYQCQTLTML